jgi:TRAP-type mannitol/chloroaromatic compound transport system substrate-binding protein
MTLQRIRSVFGTAAAVGALAACLGLATAPGAPAHAQKALKLTSYVPVGSGTWNIYHQPFIDRVHDLTDGEVKIKGYSVGVLASPFDAWKKVQQGVADICFCFPAFAANKDPVNAILAGLAGGMNTDVWMHWLFYADGAKLWRAFRRDTGDLFPVITGVGPTEIFLHSNRPVRSLADLKGMKIRTTGAWADILKVLGASPTVMAPGDIYTALERKVIDAAEFITPATNLKLGYHKIAKYIIVPGVHQPTHANEAVFRAKDWDKLSAKNRSRITQAGQLAAMDSYMRLTLQDLDAMKKLRAGRNTWIELPANVKDKVTELARAWSADQAKKQAAKGNMWMQKIQDSYWAFFDKFAKYGDYRVQ